MANEERTVTWGQWPDEDLGPWLLGLYWSEVEGRIECVGMELRSVRRPAADEEAPGSPWRGGRGRLEIPSVLSTAVLRDLPLGRIVQDTKRSQAGFRRWWAGLERERRRELLAKAKAWEGHHAGGPRGYGYRHFEEVAAIYRAAQGPDAAPGRAKPTTAVAEHYGVTKSTAAKWVARARSPEMGLLPPARRGQR
jgi:hypothetical protein